MPFNKLFPENLDLDAIANKYPMDIISARRKIQEELHESETFHGCRGVRLHMLRRDLAILEIEAILIAAKDNYAVGGNIDLTILVSMVTFPEEISFYVEMFDLVYERMLARKITLPTVRLATMIETSAIYHNIESFVNKKGRHIQFAGALFGGNDFTAATLNLNRHDAVKTVIPHYMELGILRHNPFLSLHTETVGQTICSGLRRIRRACDGRSLTIGFGGEQASDTRSVAWLTRHAAPEGLNYVTTSPDRIMDALLAAASTNKG